MRLNIEYLPINALTPYEKNARKHQTVDVDAIVASIEEFGFDDPIGVWGEQNIIVEGHGRLLAAKKLGIESVPVIRLDHLTDEQRRAYALAHNRTAELSEWDDVVKELELAGIKEIDMSLFGFDMENVPVADDDEEEEEENPTSVLPESRVYVFAVSAFGTNSETFFETVLDQDHADILLDRISKNPANEILAKLVEAVNGL